MSPFAAIAGSALSTVISVFGSSVNFTYSRPAGPALSAVNPFAISGALDSGGEFASPTGAVVGQMLVRVSDIPLGPQKGDIVTISGTSAMRTGNYMVQEIYQDPGNGWANLQIRFRQ